MGERVALIQNRVQRGGRFQVSSEMVRVLNERGIEPDFICFRNRIDLPEIKRVYGSDLKLRFINIPEPKLPFEWNILYFNRSVGSRLSAYDLVINSNNTSFGLSCPVPMISYVHFPRKYRLLSPLRSIHFPEGPSKSVFDIANDPLGLIRKRYRKDKRISSGDRQIFNSAFTAACFRKVYEMNEEDVLYPPVNEADHIRPASENDFPKKVVSMGRFSADKRQLEQIEIAARLPDWSFTLIGFVNEPDYYAQCTERIRSLGAKNVQLLNNASVEQRDKALRSAGFFIHNLRNEPFGITTIQGLAQGCLPMVHNSGGQKEIIPHADQRFDDADEAAKRLEEWAERGKDVCRKRVDALQKDIKQYTAVHFRKKFADLLNEYL